jgi:predicted HicB family RNase H-like nuclease
VSNGPEKVLNVRVSAEVKERLVADANHREVSLNDVAVGLLADHFRVSFKGTGRRSPGARTPAGPLPLRVPPSLWRRVHNAAVGQTKSDVVERVLRAHYDLDARAAA